MTVVITRTCGTCRRDRRGADFELKVSETRSQIVDICRDCRVKLWDDPDNPNEIRAAIYG